MKHQPSQAIYEALGDICLYQTRIAASTGEIPTDNQSLAWLRERYPYYTEGQREALLMVALMHINATYREWIDELDIASE